MEYKIIITATAKKDINKLDIVIKKRIGKKILLYSKNPKVHAKRLFDKRLGKYRWRIGNYRVIYDLDGRRIVILRIGHRREIYR